MEKLTRTLLCLFTFLAAALSGGLARGQTTVRFPQTNPGAYGSGAYGSTGSGIASPAPASPPAGLGAPFDPYTSGPAATPPTLTSPPPGTPLPGTTAPPPGTLAPYPGTPGAGVPGSTYAAPNATPYGAPMAQPYGSYPPGAIPSNTPPSCYPQGWNTSTWALPSTRFLTPRVRYTYVDGGNSPDDLGINDFDFSVAAAFPNFLYSSQPLYVVPSFSLHLWQGPRPPVGDLPANAYSAFLDFGWSTDPERPLGGEIGFRGGIFTDFNTFNTYSFRPMGQGLVRLRTTPTTQIRGGVVYINRNKLKLLPAFGLLWTPNSQTRFDIYFPRPKLAQQLTTMGNQDIWWYIGGEYGGGAWTVQRMAGGDRIDINDIRLIVGIEWGQSALLQQGRRTGFFEAGWVTEREFVSVSDASTSNLSDSFMLRAGWNY